MMSFTEQARRWVDKELYQINRLHNSLKDAQNASIRDKNYINHLKHCILAHVGNIEHYATQTFESMYYDAKAFYKNDVSDGKTMSHLSYMHYKMEFPSLLRRPR